MDRSVTLQSAAASPRDSVTIGHLRHAPTGPDTWSEKYSMAVGGIDDADAEDHLHPKS
jgi:hypothetical protein